jgi:predicted DNA binding CopG/RHH family protein
MKEKDDFLEKEFDFSKAKRNPYAKMLKQQVTMNVSSMAIDYFKSEAERTGIPYQTLINMYLTDCAVNKRKLKMTWEQECKW